MSSKYTISLQSAILMNLNIMAGAGIFVNIVDLTKSLGVCSGLLYMLVGLLMFPLVFTFARLVELFPSGAFYAFAKPMSPLLAFISAWTYFFGKLASATFLIHVASTFLQKLIPCLSAVNLLHIDGIILFLFLLLNSMNLRIGIMIQRSFFAAKFIPLLLLMGLGVYCCDINILHDVVCSNVSNFVMMLPLVLYCFSGFEAACSISRNIVNPSINAPKAIFYSFFSIILVYFFFQTLVAMMLLPEIGNMQNYVQAFPFLMQLLPVSVAVQAKCITLISFLIGFSAMGAAYGLLFSNAWNLYALAEHKHIVGFSKIMTLNRHGIPFVAIVIEGLICLLFFALTHGAKIPLQQTAALGCTLTYAISTIAYIVLNRGKTVLGWMSLGTCCAFLGACLLSAVQYQGASLYLFSIMFIVGICLYVCSAKNLK